MRRMLSEKDANKVRLLDNVERNIEGEIVVSDDILFDGVINFEDDVLYRGVILGVDEDGRLGQYVNVPSVSPTALTSYNDIEAGKTYHVVIPANTAIFSGAENEYIGGTISNFTPDSEKEERVAGVSTLGFGYCAGTTGGNGLIEVSESGQTIIKASNEAEIEFDITVSNVDSGTRANLYQYMYAYVSVPTFKKFAFEE